MFQQHLGQAGLEVAISSLGLSWEAWEIWEALCDDIQLFVLGALGWTQRPPPFSPRDEHILSHQHKRVPGQSLFSGRSSGMEYMHVFSRWWLSPDLPPLVKPKVMSNKTVVATTASHQDGCALRQRSEQVWILPGLGGALLDTGSDRVHRKRQVLLSWHGYNKLWQTEGLKDDRSWLLRLWEPEVRRAKYLESAEWRHPDLSGKIYSCLLQLLVTSDLWLNCPVLLPSPHCSSPQ